MPPRRKGRAAAARNPTSKRVPSKSAPAKSAPAKSAPSKSAPSKGAPSKSAPSKSAPSKSAPSKSAPSKSAPSKSAPSKSAPSKSAPSENVSPKSAPSKSAPTKSGPAKTAPAKETKPQQPPAAEKKRATPASTLVNEKSAEPPVKQQKVTATRKRSVVLPEYDEVWKEVYLAGTEWDQMNLVYDIDWDFDHVDEILTDGDLAGKKVHLFGSTEPQLVKRDEKDEKGDVIPIPVIIAVVSEAPPPSLVGLKSVQRTTEEIVPMSKLRMGWHAHAPPNVSHRRMFKPNVFVLKCNERRARLKNMQEAAVHAYDYVLPYFINPTSVEEVEEDTIVQVLADLEGRSAPLMLEYDYELDELSEFLEEQIKENELDAAKDSEPLKRSIQDAVKATKQRHKAERQAKQKRIDDISAEDKEAFKSMKLLKFYPQNEWPDISGIKSKYINRYYGQATEVL